MSQQDFQGEIEVSRFAADAMRSEAEAKWPLETGGILLGSISQGKLRVEFASGPGPKARHGVANFTRDGEFAQQQLERLVAETQGAVDYIGEWHSHTLPIGPSSRDKKSMSFIASSSGYRSPAPILLLCLPNKLSRQRNWHIRGFRLVLNRLSEYLILTK